MTHIVIPTAREPRNRCLPYALASVARFTDYEPVTIGHNPRTGTQHLESPQHSSPFENTDQAVRLACTTTWISDPFVLSADDIYWLRPADPVRWAIGDLHDPKSHGVYLQRKLSTALRLDALGLPTHDYESHTPLLVHKAPMLDALAIGGEKRSVYGNLTGGPDVIAADVKMRDRRDELPAAPYVSTAHDPTGYAHLRQHLQQRG